MIPSAFYDKHSFPHSRILDNHTNLAGAGRLVTNRQMVEKYGELLQA